MLFCAREFTRNVKLFATMRAVYYKHLTLSRCSVSPVSGISVVALPKTMQDNNLGSELHAEESPGQENLGWFRVAQKTPGAGRKAIGAGLEKGDQLAGLRPGYIDLVSEDIQWRA